MAYIAFASAKGSPGVTTTVAALAATWPPGRRLLLAELDPAGGDLAVRFELGPEPGLVTLAAAGRRALDEATLLAHTQVAPGHGRHNALATRVLPAPVSADQSTAALVALRGRLAPVLDAVQGTDVLVDCGRLDPGSPAQAVAAEAALLVVVTRPVVAEVHHLASRLANLAPRAASVVVVGEKPYPVEEVAGVVRADPLATLPDEPRAAAALSVGHPDAVRALRRSQLLRAARALAESLADWLGPVREQGPAALPAGPPALPPPAPPSPDPQPTPTGAPGEAPAPTAGRAKDPVDLPPTQAALAALPPARSPASRPRPRPSGRSDGVRPADPRAAPPPPPPSARGEPDAAPGRPDEPRLAGAPAPPPFPPDPASSLGATSPENPTSSWSAASSLGAASPPGTASQPGLALPPEPAPPAAGPPPAWPAPPPPSADHPPSRRFAPPVPSSLPAGPPAGPAPDHDPPLRFAPPDPADPTTPLPLPAPPPAPPAAWPAPPRDPAADGWPGGAAISGAGPDTTALWPAPPADDGSRRGDEVHEARHLHGVHDAAVHDTAAHGDHAGGGSVSGDRHDPRHPPAGTGRAPGSDPDGAGSPPLRDAGRWHAGPTDSHQPAAQPGDGDNDGDDRDRDDGRRPHWADGLSRQWPERAGSNEEPGW